MDRHWKARCRQLVAQAARASASGVPIRRPSEAVGNAIVVILELQEIPIERRLDSIRLLLSPEEMAWFSVVLSELFEKMEMSKQDQLGHSD